MAGNDRFFKFAEDLLLTRKILVVVSFDQQSGLHPSVEDVAKKLVGERWEQTADSGQAGKAFNVPRAQLSKKCRI